MQRLLLAIVLGSVISLALASSAAPPIVPCSYLQIGAFNWFNATSCSTAAYRQSGMAMQVSLGSCFSRIISQVDGSYNPTAQIISFQCDPITPLCANSTISKITLTPSISVSSISDCPVYFRQKYASGQCYEEWVCPGSADTKDHDQRIAEAALRAAAFRAMEQ